MESSEFSDARRGLPSLDRLLSHPAVASLISLYGREHVTIVARRVVDELRERLAADPPLTADAADAAETALAALPAAIAAAVEAALGGPLRRVLNATGIYLHTNLGRAPLPAAVARSLPPLLDAYCDLELALATGRRGQRNGRVERLLTALCGAEAALVVNNNAAALVIALAALAKDREVIVSRGELVEIGGSFRIPEIMAAAGARLERAAAAIGGEAEIVAAEAFLGGGSAPEAPIPGEARWGLAPACRCWWTRGLACCGRGRSPSSPAIPACRSSSSRESTSPAAAVTSSSAARRPACWWAAPRCSPAAGGIRSIAPCAPTARHWRRSRAFSACT